jgi:lactate dehydrogenase-like 2-hydroxyacid dehydrogenase
MRIASPTSPGSSGPRPIFVPKLPKNNYGKVLKTELRKTFRGGGTAMTDLTGKTALVTGSVQGIGLAIAEALAGAGCRIASTGWPATSRSTRSANG